MAVVIRLHGLPVIAGPADIRRFFSGLNVPDGGVHIIGKEIGEAFIIFATDEDARRAMSRSGGFIKDSPVELFLSSKAEMQNRVEMSRKKFDHGGREPISGSRQIGSENSGTSAVGNISNLVATKKGMNQFSYGPPNHLEAGYHTNGTRHVDSGIPKSNYNQSRKESTSLNQNNLYVFLRGMPYSATEDEVLLFFAGLRVDGVILLKHFNGRSKGDALVKFATPGDASKGLQRHKCYMGSRFIEVSLSTEERWLENGGRLNMKNETYSLKSKEHSSLRSSSYASSRKHSRSRSPRRLRTRSRSPRSHSPSKKEFFIHLKNLSAVVEKRDLIGFFGNLDITNNQMRIIMDKHDKKIKEAFVMLKSVGDYNGALGLHRSVFFGREVRIFPISKKSMCQLLDSCKKKDSPERAHPPPEKSYYEGHSGTKMCIYIRNFPFDVTKVEVQKFFAGFAIDEGDVYLLYDDKGVGLGEALVKFKSEEQAMKAEGLNRRRFLGTEVLLRLISEEQMREFGINIPPSVSSEKMPSHLQGFDRGEHSHPAGPHGPPMHSFGSPGSLKPPPDFRRPPEDFMYPPDNFRGPSPFMDFGGDGDPFPKMEFRNNTMGGFPEGRFMPDPHFGGGGGSSDRIPLIRMGNLPFRATPNEILDFFHGYRVIPESLSVQYNEHGLPSGDAIIAVASYDEAVAVINELSDRPVGQRKVKLCLV